MNILFLTMNNFESIHEHSIYPDLIRALASRENMVTVLSPIEKKTGIKTSIIQENNIRSIKVRTGNLFNVRLVVKAISRAGICMKYKRALRKYCKGEKFDLVLFSTPPTTLTPIIKRMKSEGAYIYLMLKDIFPQNAVDLGIIGQNSLIYKFFRKREKEIYKVADVIGCMSPANVEYLKKQDPWINPKKITICPNAIEVREKALIRGDRNEVHKKYGIPNDKLLFVYGGGLGKPQGIDFLEKCIRVISKDKVVFFVVIGNGPYYDNLASLQTELPDSIKTIQWLPVGEYEVIVQSCDVGLIMLNHRFKVPNFPSRLLLYMQSYLPVLVATDPYSDVGIIAEKNGFGFRCESNDVDGFRELVNRFKDESRRKGMGELAFSYLKNHYSVDIIADEILKKVGERI